ncbi:hypothetical protein, partial [Mesorhizobium sp. M7A.F.Ca.AU.001.01.1.1]|uniref:hypothetical protein n=2 Tax=Phyllobacteriaceae TaxID=69277 RepID=UPI0019D4408A
CDGKLPNRPLMAITGVRPMPNNAPHNALRAAVNRAIASGAPVYVNQSGRPQMAEFSSANEAVLYRQKFGGWIFVKEGETAALWFDAEFYTPSFIFRHAAASGNGRLI